MIARSLEKRVLEALQVFPIVLLNGERQIGKSTIAMKLYDNYMTMDDIEERLYALESPNAFVNGLELPICIDEIQKVPTILEYIKMRVDAQRINGSFLLTGSSNVLDHKDAKDTLAGRIAILRLYPLSSKEKDHRPDENVIERLFNKEFKVPKKEYIAELHEHIINGGYPEILKISSSRDRSLWFSSYISTYIERDARDLGDIRNIESFIKFVNVLSTRSATILNQSSLSSDVGIKDATSQKYLGILKQIFQVSTLPPYYENISKQFIKSPKVYLNDTGVLCHLLRVKESKELESSNYSGAIFETYVFNELSKHISNFSESLEFNHYRTNDKKEIDFIIKRGEEILAIEVKKSSTVKKEDFKHIIDLRQRSRSHVIGIVFYTGEIVRSYDEELYAVPMSIFL